MPQPRNRCLAVLPLVAALAACGGLPAHEIPIRPDIIEQPTPARFSHCQGYGCPELREVSLAAAQWAEVVAVFAPPPVSAIEERERIAQAIARFERIVGELTDSAGDHGGTFGHGGHGELDCIDEATNTTTYLRLLAGAGLLRWHTPGPRANRGAFVNGWPHNSATMRETANGRDWVVDSWFHDNGKPPEIVTLETWEKGWKPPGWSEF